MGFFMLSFNRHKNYMPFVFRPMFIFISVFLWEQICVVAESTPPQRLLTRVAVETSSPASVVDLVCAKIQSGDFTGAREIAYESTAFDSIALKQLKAIIDEYAVIKAVREASRDDASEEQVDELEKLRLNGLPKDGNDISEVLTAISEALEYLDKEQRQALLDDVFVKGAVRHAEQIAAEFEIKGRWLDSYKTCYSKLERLYEDDKTYSDHAEELLNKANIVTFLRSSQCENCRQRYVGIKKEMFINAVDILDSSYVDIVDYREMTIGAINRCRCLAEVMSNPYIETEYKISGAQCEIFLMELTAILDEVYRSEQKMDKSEFVDFFERVIALSESAFLSLELPPELLITQFGKGALSSLDPHTVIYWPSQAREFEKRITSRFTGIGIRFSKKEELARIISVLPDTPAFHGGVEAGDMITAIDGISTIEMSADCVAQNIAGPEGTKVTLTIKRRGEHEDRDITVHRANIVVPSIRGWQRTETGRWRFMIDDLNKIGYIRINSFNSQTTGEFEQTLVRLEEQGLAGLILDLRSNTGGLLTSAVEIADRFIEEGLIVRVQPRCGMPTYISAHKGSTHPDYPIVVLIDSFTASSSEILVGVLQEPKYKRATIVGERSYGKGSVQSIANHIGGGAKMKYTAAYYYLPSGQNIKSREMTVKMGRDDWGITPCVQVNLRNDELRKMADVHKANGLMKKDDVDNSSDVQRFSSRETIDADPQLAIGLLVLKSKMVESGYELDLD
jgi:carboxyl-terminal processing protease